MLSSAHRTRYSGRTLLFSAVKEWVPYEGIQADVFDHLLAIIPNLDYVYSRILREKILGSGVEEIKKVYYICS